MLALTAGHFLIRATGFRTGDMVPAPAPDQSLG